MPNPVVIKRSGIISARNPYLPESNRIFAAMTAAPSPARKVIINNFVSSLITSGIWALIDGLWVLAAHDSQASLLNWKNPSGTPALAVNTPTFEADRGFTGNGTTSYINTQWDPGNNGVNYTQNSASAGIYTRTNVSESKYSFGSRMASGTRATIFTSYFASAGNQSFHRLNDNTGSAHAGYVDTNSLGFYSSVRTGAAVIKDYKNGNEVVSATTSSATVVTTDFYISGYNFDGILTSPDTKQHALLYVGGSGINQSTIYSYIQTYMTAIGANV